MTQNPRSNPDTTPERHPTGAPAPQYAAGADSHQPAVGPGPQYGAGVSPHSSAGPGTQYTPGALPHRITGPGAQYGPGAAVQPAAGGGPQFGAGQVPPGRAGAEPSAGVAATAPAAEGVGKVGAAEQSGVGWSRVGACGARIPWWHGGWPLMGRDFDPAEPVRRPRRWWLRPLPGTRQRSARATGNTGRKARARPARATRSGQHRSRPVLARGRARSPASKDRALSPAPVRRTVKPRPVDPRKSSPAGLGGHSARRAPRGVQTPPSALANHSGGPQVVDGCTRSAGSVHQVERTVATEDYDTRRRFARWWGGVGMGAWNGRTSPGS